MNEQANEAMAMKIQPGVAWRWRSRSRVYCPGFPGALVIAMAVGLLASVPVVGMNEGRVGGADEVAQRYASDALVSFVLGLLRAAPETSPRVYGRVAEGLAAAGALVPWDSEIVRLELQAWDAAGELDRATAAAERLVRLDPGDTVAQLRVINARIRRLPDADARLAVYERILRDGAIGQSAIPDEVRSRLALDAALLARELDANELRFIDYLTTATALDVTNKQAAALFTAHFLERTSDPGERVDLLINLVLSDPFDVAAQRALASELLRHGAFAGAKRWKAIALGTMAGSGAGGDEDLSFGYHLCVWNTDGPLAARELLDSQRLQVLASMSRQRARLIAQGEDPGPELPPILPYRLELMSLGIDAALRDGPRMESGLQRLIAWANLMSDQVRVSGRQLAEQAENDEHRGIVAISILNAMGSLEAELLYGFLLTGLGMDQAEQLLDDLIKKRNEAEGTGADGKDRTGLSQQRAVLDERAERRMRGWIAVHRGRSDEAEGLLAPLAEENDAGARLALGMLAERRHRIDEAKLHYARLLQADPSTMLAAIALTRLENILARPVAPTRMQSRLNQASTGVAPWLEAGIRDPRTITAISARFVPATVGPLGRIVLEVRVRNAGRFPVGVGEERTIGSRFIVLPRLSVPSLSSEYQATMGRLTAQEVITAPRRLRLGPNEEIVIRVNLGRGLTGQTMRQLSAHPVNLRARVLQSFVLLQDASFSEGPMAVSAQSDLLTRTGIDTRISGEILADRLRFSEGTQLQNDLHAAFFRLNVALFAGAQGDQPPEMQRERDALRRAILDRATRMNGDEALLTATLALQFQPLAGEWGDAMRAALERHNDAAVLLMVAIAGRAEPGDPIYQRIMDLDDGALGRFAATLAAMRQRLPDLAPLEGGPLEFPAGPIEP